MIMKKFFISCALAVCVFASNMSAFAADDFSSKINELKGYNIIKGDENGDLHLEDNLTRAETVTIICRLLNLKTDNVVSGFTDVPNDFWAAGYITAAYDNGLIDGCGNGIFNPNGKVTYSEAVKMILSALGYMPKAKELGGYPDGYIDTAKEIGLTDGNVTAASDILKRKDVMELVYKSLDIPIMQVTSFGIGTEYKIMDGNNGNPLITLRKVIEEAK